MTDRPSLLALARPGLADLLQRALAALAPESRPQVEAHTTQAQRLLENAFAGLIVWQLNGSQDLWARASDVADLMDVLPNSISERIVSAKRRRDITDADVRRGVRNSDVSTPITGQASDCLTESPRGCTMLNLRAIRRLVMTCDGDRGVHFRDDLEKALEVADQAERVVFALLLADRERPTPELAPLPTPAPHDPQERVEALRLMRELVVAGKPVPHELRTLAYGAAPRVPRARALPAPTVLALQGPVVRPIIGPDGVPVLPPIPAVFSPGFTLLGWAGLAEDADLSESAARLAAQKHKLVGDPEWHEKRKTYLADGLKYQAQDRHAFKVGAGAELKRRMEATALPFPGRGEA